jgi:hypothetical protein
MPQRDHISALPVAAPKTLDPALRALCEVCEEKLDIVPNALRAYRMDPLCGGSS